MPVVPPGGTILLTGANGTLASVTVKILLDHGYKVHGTVRSATKYDWMRSYYGPSFALFEVTDFAAAGAFDEALTGVDGIIHMASDLSYAPDLGIIDTAVNGITNLLEAASKASSVKRVALTSARAACLEELPGVHYRITADTWNEAVLEELKKPAESHEPWQRGVLVYAASKLQAERAAFKFVEQKKPNFVFNSVVLNVNFGMLVAIEHRGLTSSGGLISSLDKGYPLGPTVTPNQWCIDVQDMVLLHLGALTLEEVQNERLLAMAHPFAWNDIIEILRRRFPERKNMVGLQEEKPRDIGEVDNSRALEVLRKMGKDGFKSLEDSLVEAMECIIEADKFPNIPRTAIDDINDMMFNGAGKQ